MPDPISHTDLALATGAASAATIAGTSLADVYLIFALAILGGGISHIWVKRMNFPKMLASILGSTILGVVAGLLGTNLMIATAKQFAPWLVDELRHTDIGLKMLVAFSVAFLAQKAVPIFFKWLDEKGGIAE
jgi:hypothetical protein